MNWQDIGGRTKVQHVVTGWDYGVNINILCRHYIIKHARTKDNRQLPHCQQCITVLKKLIEESNRTVQLEAKIDYPIGSRIKDMQEDMRRRQRIDQ